MGHTGVAHDCEGESTTRGDEGKPVVRDRAFYDAAPVLQTPALLCPRNPLPSVAPTLHV
jgi:hypothetical protein